MRQVEQDLMLQVIDQKWVAYLTQMDHLREGIGLQGYGQKDPLLEYKTEAFESFQDLTVDIQEEIVRVLLHIELKPVEPAPQPPPDAAREEVAPPSGSADRGREAEMPLEVPAARPAAVEASAALARATGWNRSAAGPAV